MNNEEVFAALAAALKPMNTTKDIADNCGIKEGTLAYWRSAGIGPKFVKVGRIVMYPKEQMIAYIKEEKGQRGKQIFDLIMVTKYLERIGDHATNIAEWVEFSITGVHRNNAMLMKED